MTKHVGLLALALVAALLLSGCEEALTDSNDELRPDIPGDGTPFVEFVSSDAPTGAAGATVTLTVEPGEAVNEAITVEYNASGPALGSVTPSNSVTIPFDTSTTDLDEATLDVTLAAGAASGQTATVELTGASTESGQSVQVGRGGTEIDRSRTITVE